MRKPRRNDTCSPDQKGSERNSPNHHGLNVAMRVSRLCVLFRTNRDQVAREDSRKERKEEEGSGGKGRKGGNEQRSWAHQRLDILGRVSNGRVSESVLAEVLHEAAWRAIDAHV